VTRLRVERSRVPVPVEEKYFSLLRNDQTGSGAHPASHTVVSGFVSWGKEAGE